MDLKKLESGDTILHMIDCVTRYAMAISLSLNCTLCGRVKSEGESMLVMKGDWLLPFPFSTQEKVILGLFFFGFFKQNLNKIPAIPFVVLNVNYFPLSLTYVLFSCLNLIDSLYKCVYINSMLSR